MVGVSEEGGAGVWTGLGAERAGAAWLGKEKW